MQNLITGIHHVTAVCGDAQENIDFYTGVLGLRLVKKTINFDDPKVYHFYFGDEAATPGTIFTGFPYGKGLTEGRHGNGKINTTAFSLTSDSLNYWQQRLENFRVAFKHPQQRYEGEVFIYLEDPDGMGLELVFSDKEIRAGSAWNQQIPAAYSIRGIHHVELWLAHFERTAALLTTVMDHRLLQESSGRFRYGVDDQPGRYIDIVWDMEGLRGLSGRGMVHHVAFATADAASQLKVMQKLRDFGLTTTEVKDRKYFTSVYFTEPGGVIFEVATQGPGFTLDEASGELGLQLQLPEHFEDRRSHLNEILPALHYPTANFRQ